MEHKEPNCPSNYRAHRDDNHLFWLIVAQPYKPGERLLGRHFSGGF